MCVWIFQLTIMFWQCHRFSTVCFPGQWYLSLGFVLVCTVCIWRRTHTHSGHSDHIVLYTNCLVMSALSECAFWILTSFEAGILLLLCYPDWGLLRYWVPTLINFSACERVRELYYMLKHSLLWCVDYETGSTSTREGRISSHRWNLLKSPVKCWNSEMDDAKMPLGRYSPT
jgi:hypothetical protein